MKQGDQRLETAAGQSVTLAPPDVSACQRNSNDAGANRAPSDVIGIALDGSLIKNNEYSLYSIFREETLIGYALDGFPIYGQSEVSTDECGGILADNQYRYYLSKERKAVLYCYSGTPVEI